MFVIYCIKLKFLNKFNTWKLILTIVLSLHKIDIAFTNSFIFSTVQLHYWLQLILYSYFFNYFFDSFMLKNHLLFKSYFYF